MSVKNGAVEARIGIIIGIMVPVLVNNILVEYPNAETILAVVQLLTILGFIKNIEIIRFVPVLTAIGYFLVIFTIGATVMPDWEIGLQFILAIVYGLSKIKS